MLLTLIEWDKRCFAKPHSISCLRRWAKSGRIQPQPILVGSAYQVQEDAEYVPPNRSAARQLRQAKAMMNNDPIGNIDPRVLEILNHGSSAA
ncbi:MAG: excisionase [Amphritea sp.]